MGVFLLPRKRMPESVYRAVMDRAEGMAPEPECEAIVDWSECAGRAHHWHHRVLRSQGGEHTVPNGLGVCDSCHRAIHADTARAYDNGWLVHSWDSPVLTPVLRRGVWVLLNEDGTTTKDTGKE